MDNSPLPDFDQWMIPVSRRKTIDYGDDSAYVDYSEPGRGDRMPGVAINDLSENDGYDGTPAFGLNTSNYEKKAKELYLDGIVFDSPELLAKAYHYQEMAKVQAELNNIRRRNKPLYNELTSFTDTASDRLYHNDLEKLETKLQRIAKRTLRNLNDSFDRQRYETLQEEQHDLEQQRQDAFNFKTSPNTTITHHSTNDVKAAQKLKDKYRRLLTWQEIQHKAEKAALEASFSFAEETKYEDEDYVPSFTDAAPKWATGLMSKYMKPTVKNYPDEDHEPNVAAPSRATELMAKYMKPSVAQNAREFKPSAEHKNTEVKSSIAERMKMFEASSRNNKNASHLNKGEVSKPTSSYQRELLSSTRKLSNRNVDVLPRSRTSEQSRPMSPRPKSPNKIVNMPARPKSPDRRVDPPSRPKSPSRVPLRSESPSRNTNLTSKFQSRGEQSNKSVRKSIGGIGSQPNVPNWAGSLMGKYMKETKIPEEEQVENSADSSDSSSDSSDTSSTLTQVLPPRKKSVVETKKEKATDAWAAALMAKYLK